MSNYVLIKRRSEPESDRAAKGPRRGNPGLIVENRRVPTDDAFFAIRASRAQPPGLAANDQQRRLTYGAALDQFDELMAAAAASGPRSRPLPLFYALSQAGRAIVAAHRGSSWRLQGHGLSVPNLAAQEVCDVEVQPAPRPEKGGHVDSFSGVATASGSAVLARAVPLGELWSSLPGACDFLSVQRWHRPLLAVPRESTTSPLFDFGRLDVDVVGLHGKGEEQVRAELGNYPLAAGAGLPTPQGLFVRETTQYGQAVLVRWASEGSDFWAWQRSRERLLPVDPLTGWRWLRPEVAGAAVNTLMSWWALLFGLSMLARYEPAGWVRALDLDQPGLAAQLGKLLDRAVEAVPKLVNAALTTASPPQA